MSSLSGNEFSFYSMQDCPGMKCVRCCLLFLILEKNMANKIELPRDWIVSGAELKPRTGASSSNTWVLTSRGEIKPKTGASSSNTWVFDGEELKPKSGARSSNTWVLTSDKVKPKINARYSNTYDIDGHSILVIAGQLVLRLW